MSVKEIKDLDEFKATLSAAEGAVVVDFAAKWCGPCKFIAPQFERLAAEYPGIVFCRVDVDDAEDVALEENIQAMPTFKFYKDGKQVEEVTGADLKKLTTLMEKYTAVTSAA